MPPRATLLLSIIPIGYLLALLGWSYSLGFPKNGNEGAFAALWIPIGYFITASFGLVCLVMVFRALFRRSREWIFPAMLAAVLLFTGLHLSQLVKDSFWMGVRRDLGEYDLAAIRLEVMGRLKYPESGDSDGYFGRIVPLDQIPIQLRKLSGDRICARTEDGIVVRTDGMGSWRGGYLFTPPNHETSRPDAQAIMPGVSYIISQ
jgi:hypothetical protein